MAFRLSRFPSARPVSRATPPAAAATAARRGRRGFALLIVVTLLAFIVLLLLGLATFTRVETAIAGNTQRQAQARENALLALNVAVGQLQRYAGADTRVTTTAHNFDAVNGTFPYTGVWGTDATAAAAPLTPLTWLVSGNEFTVPDTSEGAAEGATIAAPLAVTPVALGNRTVDLVGRFTTGGTSNTRNASFVTVPLVDLTSTGIPGRPSTAETVIGRYGWWVGDQGVKAPVAVADTSATVTGAPFDSADQRSRIAQQLSLGAGAADASGAPVFEPRDANNANLVANQRVAQASQFAFLRNASNGQLGLARAQQNFHVWSPNNTAVLANTKSGGLRQDLSLAPGLLGGAFAAWANYASYTEKFVPDAPVVDETGSVVTPIVVGTPPPAISPAYGSDPLRRRVTMTPHQLDGNGSHQIAPILSYFLLTFNVRSQSSSGASSPLEVRARWMLSLWNPYTAALVPENLRVEVTGLPDSVLVVSEEAGREGPLAPPFSLRTAFGSPLRMALPWDATTLPEGAPAEDRQSWLPGRVYTWRSEQNTDKNDDPPEVGFASAFYSRTLSDGGQGVQRAVNSVAGVPADVCHLEVSGATQLSVRVYAVRDSGDVLIGRFTSPEFVEAFTTSSQPLSASGYQFSYVFRLAESLDTPATPGAWLTTEGRDFRRRSPPSEIFTVEAEGNNPAAYENYSSISRPSRLLDRANDSYGYNEDVPVFELPRGPLLSLGALQHFRLTGQRPFMIGNPWGATYTLNEIRLPELFDRFYFSGLVDGMVPATTTAGDLILPNPLLKPLRAWDAGNRAYRRVSIDDVRLLMAPPSTTDADGNVIPGPAPSSTSSKYFVQTGAFNLNSPHALAWAAVLRGVRFPAPKAFTYLNPSDANGTASDTDVATVQSGDAQFFRFSQTAQETYKAEAGLAAPGEAPDPAPNTHLFRQGMRTLSAAQVTALANKIVELLAVKHRSPDSGGPFRSMDEFLTPSALFAGLDADGNPLAPRTLLEAAIADTGINADIPEFSSQFLTQADVMTALAPTLFPRSDTFVIRTYGEAVNPATNATEGRAWCEAVVQRLPEYFEAKDDDADATGDFADTAPEALTSELNKVHGRRFKVLSFRWLTRSDI